MQTNEMKKFQKMRKEVCEFGLFVFGKQDLTQNCNF